MILWTLTGAVNASFKYNLARRLVRFGLVFLTQYKVIHCFSVLISSRRTQSVTSWLSVNGTRLADFLQEVVDTSKFPTFVRKFIQQLSCAPALRQ